MAAQAGTKSRILEFLAARLGPLVIKLLGLTLRVRRRGLENIERAKGDHGSAIYAFWHGRLLLLSYLHRREGIRVLISNHQDGEYIARVIERLGFGTVRGSSTRGGAKAMKEMLGACGNGAELAITPDGPRGPGERCQTGVAYLAMRSGLPVVPIGVSHRPSIVLRSWDRFMIPLPFARCAVVYGEPVLYRGPADDQSVEAARQDLETRLKAVTAEADHEVGFAR
jgi:hypothetical protein